MANPSVTITPISGDLSAAYTDGASFGNVVPPVTVSGGGTGSGTASGAKINLGLPPIAQAALDYKSGRFYLIGPTGSVVNATNTATIASDTIFGVIGYVNNACTINALSMRTSSSNASVGASVKYAMYALNSAIAPTTLLGQTTNGTAIGDSIANQNYNGTLDSAVNVAAGIYLFCTLYTAVTTSARVTLYGSNLWLTSTGATTFGNAYGTAPLGYTGSALYATGFPSTFPTATAVTSVTNHPVMALGVQ